MDLHWHRQDLRATDNRSLAAALGAGPVLPVFVIDPSIMRYGAPPRVAFMLMALEDLREQYRALGGDLLVRRGDPTDTIVAIAEEYDVDRVVWNRDYSNLARTRDARVRDRLTDTGISWESFHDALLHEPGSITTNDGTPYSVFSYFWRKWRNRDKPTPASKPVRGDIADPQETAIPTLAELGFVTPEATIPAAGSAPGHRRLETFCRDPIYEYADTRDRPAAQGTSGLSPHLKWGTVGIRTVFQRVDHARETASTEQAGESCTAFLRQLAWREFYTHVLAGSPEIVTTNYRSFDNRIRWREDSAELAAWKDGETGYPIVDAGMRQLRSEGIMHNRLRMIVASFLTKDLLHDWRTGYAWFRKKLVDHNPGNDAGGWQWAASTGMDAQPYFRIFNPMTQGERHDPDAIYIKRHVPELRGTDPATIHNWDELSPGDRESAAPEYPAPIVDHSTRRESAIAMFEAARDGG